MKKIVAAALLIVLATATIAIAALSTLLTRLGA